MRWDDGMGRGGRERNILGNSKLTIRCNKKAGYVKRVSVGWMGVQRCVVDGVGIRII